MSIDHDSAWRSPCGKSRPDRLFLAIKPDEETARRIYQIAQKIKLARGFKGDLIAPERLHITLFSLGLHEDFSEKNMIAVHRAVAALDAMAFEITLDRTMSFPESRAFVLVGDAGFDRLRAFHRLLGAELTRNGLRRWVHMISTPHVTVLYDKHIVDEEPIEPISWMVREVLLIRSLYGQQKHDKQACWQLCD